MRDHVRRDVAAVDVESGAYVGTQQPAGPAGDVERRLSTLDVALEVGVTLNLSKRGAGLSFGRRGARLSVGRRGLTGTATLLGTGLSYVWRRRRSRR